MLPKLQLQRKYLPLAVGIVLAVIAGIMLYVYTRQLKSAADKKAKDAFTRLRENQVSILTAKYNIPQGAEIEAEMIEVQIFPRQLVDSQSVTSFDDLVGKQAVVSIKKGDPIVFTKLKQAERERGGGRFSMFIPEGKRAVTVSVDNISSLIGMAGPGDFVDVLGMISVPGSTQDGKQASQLATVPLFQNVLILAVGGEFIKRNGDGDKKSSFVEGMFGKTTKSEKKEKLSPLVTLALSFEEASIISFVQEQGKIKLILRSPLDTEEISPTNVSWDSFFQYLIKIGSLPAPASPQLQIEKPRKSVEIYRGIKKETIYLD
ncbi:MAG: Flp pilus assembly protein CpaB [Candidatus Omnitrophota bacterium]